MPKGYEVNASDLHKASQDTNTVKEHTTGHVNSLRNQLESVHAAWQGEAATAFQNLFERFNTASNKLLGDLGVISESLDTAAKSYGHNETSQADAAKKVGGNFAF